MRLINRTEPGVNLEARVWATAELLTSGTHRCLLQDASKSAYKQLIPRFPMYQAGPDNTRLIIREQASRARPCADE